MKTMLISGVLLLVVGLAAWLSPRFKYRTQQDVVKVGPVRAAVEKEKVLPVAPALGLLAMAAGAVLVVAGTRRQ